jgi:AhpD family alkylhydroperoxidase
MESRLNPFKAAPKAYEAMAALQAYVNACGLEGPLMELVKIRASQINGCAYCIDMHTKDARAAGESEQRLYMLDAWRESPFYSDRERAALEWTESLTKLVEGHVEDAVYKAVKPHFSDQELANLSLAVCSINSWNRLCVAFRAEPGHYHPGKARVESNA